MNEELLCPRCGHQMYFGGPNMSKVNENDKPVRDNSDQLPWYNCTPCGIEWEIDAVKNSLSIKKRD